MRFSIIQSHIAAGAGRSKTLDASSCSSTSKIKYLRLAATCIYTTWFLTRQEGEWVDARGALFARFHHRSGYRTVGAGAAGSCRGPRLRHRRGLHRSWHLGAKDRAKRPAFDQLHRDAVRHRFEIVMAWSVNRFGRSLKDLLAFLQHFHSLGIELFLFQQAVDTTTPAGKLCFRCWECLPILSAA